MEFNATSSAEPMQLQILVDQTILFSSVVMINALLFLIMPQRKFVKCLCEQLSCSFLPMEVEHVNDVKPIKNKSVEFNADCANEVMISRGDVEMVLEKMQLSWSCDDEQVKQHMVLEDFSRIFEDEEPSLEELKEAFCMFDHNNDGFVDAEDLHRSLLKFGFVEKMQINACKQMIKSYDRNNDGKIDFMEFVKLTEISLS